MWRHLYQYLVQINIYRYQNEFTFGLIETRKAWFEFHGDKQKHIEKMQCGEDTM